MWSGISATDGVGQAWSLLTIHSSTVISFFTVLVPSMIGVGQALSVPPVDLFRYQMPLIQAVGTRKDMSSILLWVLP